MTGDGPGVPKTPPYTGPVPQLGPWFDSSKTIVERAAALKGLSLARGRVGVFETLVFELSRRETDTTTTVADLFEAAFDDRSGAKFWRARLGLTTSREQFITMLLPHLTVERGNRSLNRLLLVSLVRENLPASGLLREGQFDPLPVVRWIGEREVYEDMLPPSLHAFLKTPSGFPEKPPEIAKPQAAEPQKRGPGRPGAGQLIKEEWLARKERGETLDVAADEARALLAWCKETHPTIKPPKLKTIQTHLSNDFATLKGQVKPS